MNPFFKSDGGDSELTQLAKTGRNPIQETRYRELLAQAGLPYFAGGNDTNTQDFLSFVNSSGGGSTGLDPAGQSIFDAINKQNEKFIAKIKEFDEKNPFVYDTILEEEMKKVGQRLDPYYKQTLDDFLTSINRKRTRSLEDERKT